MTVYHRDDSVRVTSSAIEADGRSYPLPEVAVVRRRAGPRGAGGWRVVLDRKRSPSPVRIGSTA